MSQQAPEAPGTGVKEVIDILAQTTPERLLSLTYQLGHTAEEDIVHALSLLILQREAQALEKLQARSRNILAKHLYEKWQESESQFQVFKVNCGPFLESASLATLARMYKVLTQHGLCEREDLMLAYKRALPCESSDSDVLEYNHFVEEAKEVCGPGFIEMLSSMSNLKLVSRFPSKSYMGNTSATTGSAQEKASNTPSSLHTSCSSYPTHIEISASPTQCAHNVPKTPAGAIGRAASASDPGKPMQPAQPHSTVNPSCRIHGQNPHSKPASKPIPEDPPAAKAETEQDDEEEEVKFYSFVILHALQDAEMAEAMKDRLEAIIKSDGATFSEEFAMPGKATLRCVEDAINNSAFTLLLLTTNFNNFLEMKTNSALINSIQNQPKHNTVIPLLPKSNAMPKEDFPLVLQTLVTLEENKNFEKRIQKSLSPARIKRQKEEWQKERKVKSLKVKQEKLKLLNKQQQKENEELSRVHVLEREGQMLLNQRYHFVPEQMVRPDGGQLWQQHPNINIAHANYIIIGDNSQMSVDHSTGSGDKDEE